MLTIGSDVLVRSLKRRGVVIEALSCLDIALWDIHGKHTGRSVAQLLGGYATSMPAYCTFGLSIYDRDQIVEAAKIQVTAGFKALKMVVKRSCGCEQAPVELRTTILRRLTMVHLEISE